MTGNKLDDLDIHVLKVIRGDDTTGMSWGAAMTIILENLRRAGYVAGFTDIKLTERGHEVLKEYKDEETG